MKYAEILKAWVDGSTLECRSRHDGVWTSWRDVNSATFQPAQWQFEWQELRVKVVYPTLAEIAREAFHNSFTYNETVLVGPSALKLTAWHAAAWINVVDTIRRAVQSGEFSE